MLRICAALLLAVAAGASSGCGSSSDSFSGSSTTGTLRVTEIGTGDFVTVGTTGVSVFVPQGAVFEETTLGISPFTTPGFGTTFSGNETFLSGLRFEGFTSLGRPAELRIPVFTTVPFPTDAVLAVFRETASGLVPVPLTSTAGGFVSFTTLTPGTFVIALVR